MIIPAYEARAHILGALEADLVGPFDKTATEEVLRLPPSRWYLTGFLAPESGRENAVPTDNEELGAGSDTHEEESQSGGTETDPKRRQLFPASMGLSVMLPAGSTNDHVSIHLTYADYVRDSHENDQIPTTDFDNTDASSDGKKRKRKHYLWRRVPRDVPAIAVALEPKTLERGLEIPNTEGLWLIGKLEETKAPGLPKEGARALTVFVVNRRPPRTGPTQDESFIFQVKMTLHASMGLLPRPDRRGSDSPEFDDQVSDLQFRHRFEYAVGHGVAVEPPPSAELTPDGTPLEHNAAAESKQAKTVRSSWIPRYEVPRVVTRDPPNGLEVSMEALAGITDVEGVVNALSALPEAYGAWLESCSDVPLETTKQDQTRKLLIARGHAAAERMRAGITLLQQDAEAREAFVLANQAMAMAARQRSPERYENDAVPSWRLFQLGFVLLCLRGIVEEQHHDRRIADLIFFPTGGGKTEAYLGLIAFTLLLRRLRGRMRPDGGLGVAVLLRYTLRLLTLDQLSRAATLICALERIRWGEPKRLGNERFSVGLWVGKSATANTLADVSKRIVEYKNNASKSAVSPCPLTHCPWCGEELGKKSLTLSPSVKEPREVILGCSNYKNCDFNVNKNREGLPVVFVDDQLYRELPAFVVATVDKFAMMPWRGETGMLFGRASARMGREMFGPMAKAPKKGATALPEGLRPPELIVQDELHLIAGPLGTMCGLYEAAIEALCTRYVPQPGSDEPRVVRPKIVASTATVRRAERQIRTLFARGDTSIFPPQGIDDSETYFGEVVRNEPGRLYVGVAAAGRSMKAVLLRTYVALLGSAYRVLDPEADSAGGQADAIQHAEAYSTLVGYFNSLRELGGMRRLVEDEVRLRCSDLEQRRPVAVGKAPPHPWFRNRLLQLEPVELTSRESTGGIKDAKARLNRPWPDKVDRKHVDVALASNMISVGVDIERLGLMVIAGQPKTTAEYIQASSRVGRLASRPGLVVTCLNLFRPRDRSHFERFSAYHQSFYRFVEATSATPFSGPALDRGFAGTLVAMVRLLGTELTHPDEMNKLHAIRAYAEQAVERLAKRGAIVATAGSDANEQDEQAWKQMLQHRGKGLLDAWESILAQAATDAASRKYGVYERAGSGRPLLHTALDEDLPPSGTDEAKFIAPTSMRDVEPESHLWLKRQKLGGGK